MILQNFKIFIIRFILLLITINNCQGKTISFDIEIDDRLVEYSYLLENPSYGILCMINIGLNLSSTKTINIVNKSEFNIGEGSLRFVKKINSNEYFYKLKLNNNLLNSNTDIINSTMVIELKKNEKNKVLSIKADSLALNAVPDFIIDKIVSKFKTLLILENQYKLFLYIDNISKINQGNKNDIYNSILIDSYNNSLTYSSQSPQFGNADIRSSTYLLYIFILSITTLVFLSLWIRNIRIIKLKKC